MRNKYLKDTINELYDAFVKIYERRPWQYANTNDSVFINADYTIASGVVKTIKCECTEGS